MPEPRDESISGKLRRKYGDEIDPSVSLDPGASGAAPSFPSGHSSAMVQRLEKHGLKQSRYRLRGEIARGGMGAIIKIWDEDIRRELAMKVVLGRDSEGGSSASAEDVDVRVLGRFLEEAQITGQLDHPGVVPVHELGIDDTGQVYFTMRLVRGRDLQAIFDLIQKEEEGWTRVRALGVMLKVCEAMAYAHAKGVIHRDLKPANVMVGRFGEVYVMDWGLARILGQPDRHDIRVQEGAAPSPVETDRQESLQDSLAGSLESGLVTMDGDVIGTPSYMSPEQSRGKIDEVGPRADVYAVGAMLYHLLTGVAPYTLPGEKTSIVEIMQRCWAGPPEPVHSLNKILPAELVSICEKAMAREPADRYADMQELAEDLRAFMENRVVKAHQTGAVAELKKWVARNKALAAATAASILLSLAGLGTVGYVQARGRRIANEQRQIAETSEIKANENAAEARRQEAIARRERSSVLRLSAYQNLLGLQTQAAQLWPASPENTEAYEDWLVEAELLVAGLQPDSAKDDIGHYAQLEELRARALPGQDSSGAEFHFDDATDQWWYGQLTSLIAELEAFADEEIGLMRGMSAQWGWGIERRLEFARTVEERTRTGERARELWQEAIASIGDPAQCPAYGGLAIEPQLGLLPIGRDPRSGLWEFAHLQTGEAPVRDENGTLVLTEEMGIVFVLLPGGSFFMGAQSRDPNGHNYDRGAQINEAPVHEVALDPFFISKFEMTQGQWVRFTGSNPSQYPPGQTLLLEWKHDLRNPVEEVSWEACTKALAHLGLALPTEAQWEYGARAGTSTPWFTGAERNSLEGFVNLADQAGRRAGASWPALEDWPELDDGYAVHAPVGTYEPNGFGLHEVHGNLWEWCKDLYSRASYSLPYHPGDGEHTGGEARERAIRGGGYGNAASPRARSAFRYYSSPEFQQDDVGLRPARPLDR